MKQLLQLAFTFFGFKYQDTNCFVLQVNTPAVSIDGHENVPANDENALMKAVANQPVSVAIDASGIDFQLYSKVATIIIFICFKIQSQSLTKNDLIAGSV